MKLPIEGKTRVDVMKLLERSMAGDLAWQEGRTFSLVYGAGEEHLRLLRDAYALFMATNGLGAGRMFKSLAALEAELVGMSAELLGGAGCPAAGAAGALGACRSGAASARVALTFSPALTLSSPSTMTRSLGFNPCSMIQSEPTRSPTLTLRTSTVSSAPTTPTSWRPC